MIISLVTIFVFLVGGSSAINCGPHMLTFQHVTQASNNNGSSQSNESALPSGILCVLVSNGKSPRFVIYGESQLPSNSNNSGASATGNNQSFTAKRGMRIFGRASGVNTAQTSTQQSPQSSIVNIGGFQVESQLDGTLVKNVIDQSSGQSVQSLTEQVSIAVFPDHLEISPTNQQGRAQQSQHKVIFKLVQDVPGMKPLELPKSCGQGLTQYGVYYPEGVHAPQPSQGIRCALTDSNSPQSTQVPSLTDAFFGTGLLGDKSYLYVAVKGDQGKWGRAALCWHSPELQSLAKCPKSDWGSFDVKEVDISQGRLSIQDEVTNKGLREVWISARGGALQAKGNGNLGQSQQSNQGSNNQGQ